MNTLRRIGGWLTPYRGRMALALALTTLACLFNLPVPLLVQALVDRVVTQNRWDALPLYALALFGVFAVQAVLRLFNSLVIGQIGQGVVRDLRHLLYERLQQLGLAYYDKTPSGAIIARVMDDVGAIQVFVTGQTFTILTDLGTTLAIAALLLARDWRLAVVVLAVAPLFALNFRYFMRRIRATNTIIREKMDLLFGNLKAKLDGSIVIKAYAREPEEIADFAAQLDDAHVPRVQESQSGRGLFQYQRGDRRRGDGPGVCGRGVGSAPGPADARRSRLDGGPGRHGLRPGGAAGRPGVCLRADGRQRRPPGRDPRPRARRGRAGAVGGPGAARSWRASPRSCRVRPCRLRLPAGEPVVWDIRLKVEPGMKIALVGPTGCGKSTLVNLLMRFYDPTWGEIRLDGVPIHRIPTRDAPPADRRGLARPGRLSAEPGGQHPLRRGRRDRRRWSKPPPVPRWSTNLPRPCPRATPRSSARGATSSVRESGSGWRSPAPSARTRPWSSSTRRPARWIPPARP